MAQQQRGIFTSPQGVLIGLITGTLGMLVAKEWIVPLLMMRHEVNSFAANLIGGAVFALSFMLPQRLLGRNSESKMSRKIQSGAHPSHEERE